MKKHIDDFVAALNFTWEELFDFQLPQIFKNDSECNEKNCFVLAAFPLVGFIVGGVVALLAELVSAIFNFQAGGVVFALLSWGILCFKDSGRGDSWLAAWVANKLQNHENSDFTRNILMIFPVMLKFIILLFIGMWSGRFYFALLLSGAFALQAVLASSENCRNQFIRFDDKGMIVFRLTLVVIGLAGFILCTIGAIGAIAIVCGLFILFNKKFTEEGCSADAISRAGYCAEWALLFTGLLLLMKI